LAAAARDHVVAPVGAVVVLVMLIVYQLHRVTRTLLLLALLE
jgi:hypothetical protein